MADGVHGEIGYGTTANFLSLHGGPHEVLVDKADPSLCSETVQGVRSKPGVLGRFDRWSLNGPVDLPEPNRRRLENRLGAGRCGTSGRSSRTPARRAKGCQGKRECRSFQRLRKGHVMNRTYDNHVTALRLRRRASLTVSLVIPILTIAWLASAGVARAAGAPDTCTQGPNAGRAKAAANAGITAANSLQTNASHLITITAARNIWGWQDGGRLVAGVDTLQQELDALAAITPTGTGSTQAVPVHFATVPGFTPNTGSYPAGSTSGNIYPSFAAADLLPKCVRLGGRHGLWRRLSQLAGG